MKLWKIFPVFAQEKGKILTHKNFELYEVQWSRLLHLWIGVARRLLEMKKKMMRRNFSKVLQCVKLEEK